jgi:hypothetical protein
LYAQSLSAGVKPADALAAEVIVSPLPTFTLEIPGGAGATVLREQKVKSTHSGNTNIVFFILTVLVAQKPQPCQNLI